MKCAQIKLAAQFLLRPSPQLKNLQLPHLVAQRLRGPSNVTINLGIDRRIVQPRVRLEELHHLVARPVLRVHARIHYQTNRPENISLQPPIV